MIWHKMTTLEYPQPAGRYPASPAVAQLYATLHQQIRLI